MAQLAEPKRRKWTRREYYRMAELGMFRSQRVELVGGEIVEMAAQKDTHVISLSLTGRAITKAFGEGYWVRSQAPVNLGPTDDPEPDIVVVVGSERDYVGSENRVTALLVVEVSDTTLAFHRGRKAWRYARKGITDYWVVNLVSNQLEVYRNPVRRGFGFRYGPPVVLRRGESIAPLAAPNSLVKVDDLLP